MEGFTYFLLKTFITFKEKERSILYHFQYLLETHEPDRAIILTSILFKIEEEKVLEICQSPYKKAIDLFIITQGI